MTKNQRRKTCRLRSHCSGGCERRSSERRFLYPKAEADTINAMKHKTRLACWRNTMRKAAAAFCIGAGVLCLTLSASGEAKGNKQHQTLTVSKDGKYLLDAKGNKVKQYLKSAKAFVPMTAKDKKGHEFDPVNPNKLIKGDGDCHPHPCNCHPECIRWDENGRCNATYRTCDICC